MRHARYRYDQLQTQKLNESIHKNAKAYWKLLKGASNISKPNLSLSNFAAYFKAVNNPDSAFYTPDDDVIYFNERYLNGELQVMFSELDVSISMIEVSKTIDELSNGKSAGPDRLINEFFINGKAFLIPYLHILFNKVSK